MGKYQDLTQSQNENSKRKIIQKNRNTLNNQTNKESSKTSHVETISLIDEPRPHTIREFVYMPNVEFYLNKMSSAPNGTFIDLLHKHWWGDYRTLQVNHSYIQWLFPNSFQSRFNQAAKPLTKEEAKHFRQNLNIAKRYVHSYEMILEFFGMKLRNRITGELTRTIVPRYKDRYDETLLSAYHNHLRITRILCSLTEVGFAFYARELCKFLKRQIYEHNGRLIRLKHMDVYKHWRPYEGDDKKRSNKIDVQDVPNIYLRELWKQQGYNPHFKQRSKWSQVYDKNKATIILSQSDDEKVETKIAANNYTKNEQKYENKQISTKFKTQYRQDSKPKKIQLGGNQSQAQPSQNLSNSQEFSQEQDLVEEKQYGRRGSKQFQALKRQLATSQYASEKQKFLRMLRKQQQYEKKIQMNIKSRLQQQNDNHIKRQMNELRAKYDQKLKQFRNTGPRVAQTIQERQKRMMSKVKMQQYDQQSDE